MTTNIIQKCDCGKTGCGRYVILPHTPSYTVSQLVELRDDIEEFLFHLKSDTPSVEVK